MLDATFFVRQWEGLVAQVRMFGTHAPRAELVERDGMVAAIMPVAPNSSLMNVAIAVDPTSTPHHLAELSERYRNAGVDKWGLWVDADHTSSAEAAAAHGMVLDSRPRAMVADLQALDRHEAPPHRATALTTVGRINDLAYGFPDPMLEPSIGALPPTVLTYAAPAEGEPASVAMAFDAGTDTAVWYVATTPDRRGQGLATDILRRLLEDARERGQRTASLQASAAGAPMYERLGFNPVGSLHLHEERLR